MGTDTTNLSLYKPAAAETGLACSRQRELRHARHDSRQLVGSQPVRYVHYQNGL